MTDLYVDVFDKSYQIKKISNFKSIGKDSAIGEYACHRYNGKSAIDYALVSRSIFTHVTDLYVDVFDKSYQIKKISNFKSIGKDSAIGEYACHRYNGKSAIDYALVSRSIFTHVTDLYVDVFDKSYQIKKISNFKSIGKDSAIGEYACHRYNGKSAIDYALVSRSIFTHVTDLYVDVFDKSYQIKKISNFKSIGKDSAIGEYACHRYNGKSAIDYALVSRSIFTHVTDLYVDVFDKTVPD